MRKLGLYLTTNISYAAWVALAFALLPIAGWQCGWISSIIIGLLTLQRGYKAGFFVLAWAALPGIALAVDGDPNFLVNLVLLQCLPVWIMAIILRAYGSWTKVIETAVAIGIIGIIVLHATVHDLTHWWMNQLTPFWTQMNQSYGYTFSAGQSKQIIGVISQLATGLIAALLAIVDLIILMFARWWQDAAFTPGILRKEFYGLRTGYLTGGILLTSCLALFVNISIVLDLLPIVLLPFVLAGLSLVHALLANRKAPYLIGFYIVVIFLLPYSTLFLALVGLIDSCYDFRRRNLSFKVN